MYYRYLQGRLKQLGIERDELAIKLNLSKPSLSRRFNNRIPWTLTEMYQVMDAMDADSKELAKYFPRGGMSA